MTSALTSLPKSAELRDAIVDVLYANSSFATKDVVAAVELLGREGGLYEFYCLGSAGTSGDRDVRVAAYAAATAMQHRLSPDAFFFGDRIARASDGVYYRHRDVGQVPSWTPETEAMLIVLCASANGMVRQAAVSKLAAALVGHQPAERAAKPVRSYRWGKLRRLREQIEPAMPIPGEPGVVAPSLGVVFALLARVSDWTPAVRAAATPIVDTALHALSTQDLLNVLPALIQLQQRTRSRDNAVVGRAIARAANIPAGDLFATLSSADRAKRRAALEIVLAHPAKLAVESSFDAAMASTDPVVRGRVVRLMLTTDLGIDVADRVAGLFEDASAAVRLETLHWCADNRGSDWVERLERLCLDPASSVQDAAIFYLDKARPGRGAELFRTVLQSPTTALRARAALRGLAATSQGASDVALMAGYLNDSRASVLRAALFALIPHADSVATEDLLPLLLVDERRTSWAALELCCARPGGRQRMIDVLKSTTKPVHRLRYYRLRLLERGKWDRLEILLAAAVEVEPVRKWAQHRLSEWCLAFNQSFVTTSEQAMARCVLLLTEAEQSLGTSLTAALRDYCDQAPLRR